MKARPSLRVPFAAAVGVVTAFAIASGGPGRAPPCEKTWVFFDLGNTVINSHPGQESRYLPGVHAYIRELRRRGNPIGLITNVPEKWAPSRSGRIKILKKMVAEGWTKEAGAETMDWADFPDSAIVIPSGDAYRKPGPHPFQTALAQVSVLEGTRKCRVVFQGEDPIEVSAAEKNGMIGYVVGKDPAAPYLPIDWLERQ